jgi:hypothetical protein
MTSETALPRDCFGQRGSRWGSAVARAGFERMLSEVRLRNVGAVAAPEEA